MKAVCTCHLLKTADCRHPITENVNIVIDIKKRKFIFATLHMRISLLSYRHQRFLFLRQDKHFVEQDGLRTIGRVS